MIEEVHEPAHLLGFSPNRDILNNKPTKDHLINQRLHKDMLCVSCVGQFVFSFSLRRTYVTDGGFFCFTSDL